MIPLPQQNRFYSYSWYWCNSSAQNLRFSSLVYLYIFIWTVSVRLDSVISCTRAQVLQLETRGSRLSAWSSPSESKGVYDVKLFRFHFIFTYLMYAEIITPPPREYQVDRCAHVKVCISVGCFSKGRWWHSNLIFNMREAKDESFCLLVKRIIERIYLFIFIFVCRIHARLTISYQTSLRTVYMFPLILTFFSFYLLVFNPFCTQV